MSPGARVGLLVAGLLSWALPALGESPVRPAPARASRILRKSAHASLLSTRERASLLAGDTVSRPMVFTRGDDQRYVGGVSYQVVRASPDEVLAALGTVKELPEMLPRTRSARLVDVSRGAARIELTQGNQLVETTYTVRLRRKGSSELRFELDPSRPHGIRDVYGYMRVRSLGPGQTLVTVAVALDLGPGLARALFEDRIQKVILDTPRKIRDYLEPKVLSRREAQGRRGPEEKL